MSDTIIRTTPLVAPRTATPPPIAARGAGSPRASSPGALARYAVSLVAIVLVVVVVALLVRADAPEGASALPLPVVAVAGLGAAAVSTTLRRVGVRNQSPSPRRATTAPKVRARRAGARRRESLARRPWPRLLLRTSVTLGVAALMLALVVRSPHSAPLLLGVGLTSILGLRLAAPPPRVPMRA